MEDYFEEIEEIKGDFENLQKIANLLKEKNNEYKGKAGEKAKLV